MKRDKSHQVITQLEMHLFLRKKSDMQEIQRHLRRQLKAGATIEPGPLKMTATGNVNAT